MKIAYKILVILFLIVGTFGCSEDFGDMNTPKNTVVEVNPSYFLSNMVQGVFDNYQRNHNLYDDFYSQYWANTVSGFESPRYEYVDGWIGNQWKEFYTDHLTEANAIKTQNQEDPFSNDIVAASEIWISYFWSRMTDTYGDIPYTDAGLGDPVPYNDQQEIYNDLFARIENAVSSIKGTEDQKLFGNFISRRNPDELEYDHLYLGDISKWQKFGNSLRLRLAMRLSNVDPTKAAAEVAAAINGPGGLMTSNDDVAKVRMWSKGWYDYLHQMAWSWDNIRASETFTNYLYNQSSDGEDPRAPRWFAYKIGGQAVSKEEAGFDKYYGLENGWNTVPAKADEDHCTINLEGGYIDFIGADDDGMYCPVMFYSEVLFLQAEAALRGWTSGDANALYKAGVQASMDYVGVDPADAQAYIDGLPDLTGSNEAKLKQIITQKWLAGFPNGVEAWADFRRTDYPDITLPFEGVSGNSSVAQGTWVKRVRYPDNEHEQNQVSMPSDMNTLDTDRMDKRVWWDVADTKTKGGDGLMNSNF